MGRSVPWCDPGGRRGSGPCAAGDGEHAVHRGSPGYPAATPERSRQGEPARTRARERDLMKAVTWQGRRDVRVEDVPDPRIEEPTDAVIRITSSAVCGSDLHLYEVLGPYLKPGDVLGHEPMGIVEEVGSGVDRLEPGDRVVVPFNIACG